ncbi:MAG: exodeoxyribonuclease V subunit beta [Planctomycetota bacterium]|jgi:exodeoxyribonuclease V beta subunit
MKSLITEIAKPDFAFDKSSLIEASAGTGKTYSIQTIFLRAIVEHGIPVEKILTVTFTEAATKELRDRLRAVLNDCYLVLSGHKDAGKDERIADILTHQLKGYLPKEIPENEIRKNRISTALQNFDQAAIHTIHGFCSRSLNHYAFECRHDFSAELTEERNDLLDEICEDWWRKNIYEADPLLLLMTSTAKLDIPKIKKMVKKSISRPFAVLKPECDNIPEADKVAAAFTGMLDEWDRDAVLADIKYAAVHGSRLRIDRQLRISDMLDGLKEGTFYGDITELEKFTSENLDSILTKKSPGPVSHPFFNKCDDFYKLFLLSSSTLCTKIVKEIREQYSSRKHLQQTITYDDLLIDLKNALSDDETKELLLKNLQNEYELALIDEFQDTDPLQYSIFKTVFVDSEKPVFLVGDPKQAIYSFRSGDIFTYYSAAAEVSEETKYSLDTNWRSEAALVDAVNLIFKDMPESNTFINENISYPGKLTASGKKVKPLLIDGKADPAPFKIWNYEDAADYNQSANSLCINRIFSHTADEIVSLLNNQEAKIDGRRLLPSDFAVLVTSHAESEIIADSLRKRNVPVVIQKTGDIFKSSEAEDMIILLKSLLKPGKTNLLRAALVTDYFPCSDSEISAMLDNATSSSEITGQKTLDDWLNLFSEAHKVWEKGSFFQAVAFLSDKGGIESCLAERENGERRLTNLKQLVQLINKALLEESISMEDTLPWLIRKCSAEDSDKENELRLESDDDAVKVMTIYKSKGLEFPIVFIPTLWRRKNEVKYTEAAYQYHINSSDKKNPLLLDLEKSDAGKSANMEELKEEDIRLFYVAATRAANRCYLAGGTFTAESPLKSIFGEDIKGRLLEKNGKVDFSMINIAEKEISQLPNEEPYQFEEDSTQKLQTADLVYGHSNLSVDKTHRHTSFTGIAPAHSKAPGLEYEKYDYDETDSWSSLTTVNPENEQNTIFNFPAGARTGNCWHSIFELLDFQAVGSEIEKITTEEMQKYGFLNNNKEESIQLVATMVKNVLTAQLPGSEPFSLCDIAVNKCRREMEFSFKLAENRDIATTDITAILQKHWQGSHNEIFIDTLAGWQRYLPKGFFTGVIDLLFVHSDKYYVLDWKSNCLGGTPDSFTDADIKAEMTANAYFLQYLIYTTAVHNYLKGCLADYNYEKHIGGAVYIFLRGAESGSSRGIFYDLPSQDLIEELSQLLGDFS